MANLKFSFPGIPLDAIDVAAAVSSTNNTTPRDIANGRAGTYITSSTSTDLDFTFYLGSGNAQTPDHIIVRDASIYSGSNADRLMVRRSSNVSGGSWVADFDDTSFDSAAYIGKNDNIYHSAVTSSSFVSWQVRFITSSGSATFYLENVHLGAYFEINTEVETYQIRDAYPYNSWFQSSDHSVWATRVADERLAFNIEWVGVSDAKIEALETKLQEPLNRYVFLYASSNTEVLGGESIRHVEIKDVRYRNVFDDWNVLRMQFEELY